QDVFFAYMEDGVEKIRQTALTEGDAGGGSPLRLSVREMPLGLVLRWIERRAKFPAGENAGFTLDYEIGPAGRLQFRLQPRGALILDSHVAGADVNFLYPH